MRELVAYLEGQARTLTLYDFTGTDEQLRELSQWLGGYGVHVETAATTDAAREDVAVLHRGDAVLGACAGEELLSRLSFERAVTDGEAPPIPEMVASLSPEVTVHPSRSVKEMVRVSRDFERRALREGAGELHAGFQQLSQIATSDRTMEMYRTLASDGVDVYVYGYPNVTLDDIPFTVVEDDESELEQHWFLLYDGNGNPDRKAALVSEECAPTAEQPVDATPMEGRDDTATVYDSFFTTDPATVDALFELARDTHGDLMAV